MNNMAKESKRQRNLDSNRWEYLRKQNGSTRNQWLNQLEEQLNEAHSKLQMQQCGHQSGRPHTGYELSRVRINPSALVGKIRVNGKFQLGNKRITDQDEAPKRLYDMFKTEPR